MLKLSQFNRCCGLTSSCAKSLATRVIVGQPLRRMETIESGMTACVSGDVLELFCMESDCCDSALTNTRGSIPRTSILSASLLNWVVFPSFRTLESDSSRDPRVNDANSSNALYCSSCGRVTRTLHTPLHSDVRSATERASELRGDEQQACHASEKWNNRRSECIVIM